LDGVRVIRRTIPAAVAAILALSTLSACTSSSSDMPECTSTSEKLFVLMAQSVPSATQLPCVAKLPAGWRFGGSEVQSGRTRFWLDSDRAGIRAVEVDLTPSCDTSEGEATPPGPDELNMQVFFVPGLTPSFSATRFAVFAGGCVTYHYQFGADAPAGLTAEAEDALSFLSRVVIVRKVKLEFGLSLCGASAGECAG
jgi:hypothetical protein